MNSSLFVFTLHTEMMGGVFFVEYSDIPPKLHDCERCTDMARKSGEGVCCPHGNAHSPRYALCHHFTVLADLISLLFFRFFPRFADVGGASKSFERRLLDFCV